MKEIMEWVKDILLAVVIAAVILAFFKPIIVQQQSMEPNFHAGDYLITSRQAYRLFGDPQRGDVIVFKSELLDENEKPKNLIKRIIALPGETIEIKGGEVYIDGAQLREAAKNAAKTKKAEMRRVVVHGLLHLCGQKDKTPRANAQMHRKEDHYLRQWDELSKGLK